MSQRYSETNTGLHSIVLGGEPWDRTQSGLYAAEMFREGHHFPQDHGPLYRCILYTEQ
jgi:hypothetical protein